MYTLQCIVVCLVGTHKVNQVKEEWKQVIKIIIGQDKHKASTILYRPKSTYGAFRCRSDQVHQSNKYLNHYIHVYHMKHNKFV